MDIELKPVTRENWQDAISLRVFENQQNFVPTVAVSLAKIYIKPDGENVEYLPFAIYDKEKIIGFMMHAYVESTSDMYWINGFLIDAGEQRKGYGRVALDQMISSIRNRFSQCSEIRLTVHRANTSAKRLYLHRGFQETGEWSGEEEIMRLEINTSV